MRVNVERVLERDQKLSELDDRAGERLTGIIPSYRVAEHCLAVADIWACILTNIVCKDDMHHLFQTIYKLTTYLRSVQQKSRYNWWQWSVSWVTPYKIYWSVSPIIVIALPMTYLVYGLVRDMFKDWVMMYPNFSLPDICGSSHSGSL